jgi:hypothetical protein
MIQRFSHLPRSITRRQFGRFAMGTGAAIGAEYVSTRKARAFAGSPFTIILVPDPQYLASNTYCGNSSSSPYNTLIQWAITNRNLSVGGIPLNVKGILQVGDCTDVCSPSVYEIQQQRSVTAYALAEAASPKMFVVRCPGNHDMYDNVTVSRSNIGYMWRTDTNGAWSPANVASIYSGGMDLGSGDFAIFGGVYPDPTFPVSTANNYMFLNLQGVKIGVLSLECWPRSAVLNWARAIHDAHPNYQWWITTHCYLDSTGARCTPGSTWGPGPSGFAAAPVSNAGDGMWAGSDGTWTNGLNTWPNLTGIFCGHWIGGYSGGSNWIWKKLSAASSSARGQTVHAVFCDAQDNDKVTTFCSGGSGAIDGTSDVMHLMALRIDPATYLMESYMLSVNIHNASGHGWIGASGVVNSSTPVQLFNVSVPAPHGGLFPMPSTVSAG